MTKVLNINHRNISNLYGEICIEIGHLAEGRSTRYDQDVVNALGARHANLLIF